MPCGAPHTIDRFANSFNHQLARFNSRFGDPGAEAVDAFTCDWANENNWWCPPLYLVLSCHRWSPQNGSPGPSAANYVAMDGPPEPSTAAIDGRSGPRK